MSTISAADPARADEQGTGASTGGSDVAIVAPTGVLDDQSLRELDEVVAQTVTPAVVIDLTDCMLANPRITAALDARRWSRRAGDVCIVCRRLSGRRMLSAVGVLLPVFSSVQDASQALILGDAGYGVGWR